MTDVAMIQALEIARYEAMRTGDVAALQALCAEDMLYTHSNAETDSKADYIGKVRSGIYIYHELHHQADRILVVGDTALVHGQMTAKVEISGAIRDVNTISLAVWLQRDGRWQLAAYQPTRLPTAD